MDVFIYKITYLYTGKVNLTMICTELSKMGSFIVNMP